ncbi:hypothetical protein SLE2022_316800 [Rubroshorea leprosula]
MGRLIWFFQILFLSFMLLQVRIQSSSPSQSSLDSSPRLCRPEERSALLNFKNTTSHGLETWNKSIDCCLWKGITCDKTEGRHVIGLNLSWNFIQANLTANSSLFRLEKLQSLNLSYNDFSYPDISFGFHRWKSLTYLKSVKYEISFLSFFEIFMLPKLVSLPLV